MTDAAPDSPAPESASDSAPSAAPASSPPATWLAGGSYWTRFLRTVGGSAITGVLLALSFPPAGAWPLAWVALLPWFVVLAQSDRFATFVSGFFVGGIWYAACIGWIANLHPAVGIYALLATASILSFQLSIIGFVIRAFLRRGSRFGLVAAGSVWVALEYLKTVAWIPLPFPWLLLGTSQVPFLPVAQVADLGGVWLLGGLIVAVNLCLAAPLIRSARPGDGDAAPRRRWWLAPAVGVGLFVLACLYGVVRIGQVHAATQPGPRIALTQPNLVYLPDRPRASPRAALYPLTVQAWQEDPDIIAWPEAMLFGVGVRAEIGSDDPDRNDEQVLRILTRDIQFAAARQYPDARDELGEWPYLLVGTSFLIDEYHPTLEFEGGHKVQLDQDGAHLVSPPDETGQVHVVGYYAKRELVPAGEYIPYAESLPFVADFVKAGMQGGVPAVKPGEGPVHMELDTARTPWSETPPHPFVEGTRVYTFGAPICYELAFAPTIRELVAGPESASRPADFLLNISDDSWYQQSAELDQMLAMGQLRCIENRRGMARCTNTGISAFITPTGELRRVLAIDGRTREVGPALLVDRVDVTNATSLYTALGDWAAWLACALVVIGLLLPWVTRGRDVVSEPAAPAEPTSA